MIKSKLELLAGLSILLLPLSIILVQVTLMFALVIGMPILLVLHLLGISIC